MSLLRYKFECVNCEEQFFIVIKQDGSVPGFCPICSEPLGEEIVEDEND